MSKKELVNTPAQRSSWSYYILIAAVSILIYANTLKHGFVLDDVAVISNNKFVQAGVKGVPDILTTFYWEGYWNSNAGLYRPLSLIAFALEHEISSEPFIHHLSAICYYALLCCLLFEFLCRIFNKIDLRFFLFAVLLFIVHPIHTEVVANIKSRDELFSLLFFLLCCRQLYILPGNGKKRMILSSVFFLLALLSKEGAIVFLPVIFLIDYMNKRNITVLIKKRAALLLITAAWFAWHRYIIISSSSPRITYTYSDNSLLASSSVLDQKATALSLFARYIIKSFYPYNLSYDYSFNEIPIVSLISIPALCGLLMFGTIIWLAFKTFNTNPLITFCMAMILLPLMLTGNLFFNIGATMGDRFLFVPTIGSCILICWLTFKLFKTGLSVKAPAPVQYILLAIFLLFSIRTYTRNKDWKDDFTLFKNDVDNAPGSARVHFNNALVLEKTITNDPRMAQKEYELCLSIDPYYHDAVLNLGNIYTRQANYASALTLYRTYLGKYKDNPDAIGNMGYTFYKMGLRDSAAYYLKRADSTGHINASSYNVLGTLFFEKKEYAEAISAYEKGVKKDSTNAEMYNNYGNVLALTNRYDAALKAFQNSYRINNNKQALYFMAITCNKLGDTVNAYKYYDAFKKLNQ